MVYLRNWKTRRSDKRVENYWKDYEAKWGKLNSYRQYQREWNFIETDYSDAPSNNELDICNPGFAFDKKLTRYLVYTSEVERNRETD